MKGLENNWHMQLRFYLNTCITKEKEKKTLI